MRHGDHHSHGRHGHRGEEHRHGGAQTFRRGRALAFLETLNIKRDTLIEQLEQSELQSISPIIQGELKAIEMVRNEFIAMFELHESLDKKEEQTCVESNADGPSDPPGSERED